jgi:hypothetical protein
MARPILLSVLILGSLTLATAAGESPLKYPATKRVKHVDDYQ